MFDGCTTCIYFGIIFLKRGESTIVRQRSFLAHFVFHFNDAVPFEIKSHKNTSESIDRQRSYLDVINLIQLEKHSVCKW